MLPKWHPINVDAMSFLPHMPAGNSSLTESLNQKSDFIQIFVHDFINVYSPGAVADYPDGQNSACYRKIM